MDITLTRILSLLEKKPNGQFVYGAKKKFAERIGYDSGDIVSMWIGGTSRSYLKKLHEISSVYGVSVEWLKGETEEKNPSATSSGGVSPVKQELLDRIPFLSDKKVQALLDLIDGD